MGYVYAIATEDGARVKIGYTNNPARRLWKMRAESPVELVMFKHIAGTKRLEGKLHELFKLHRLHREWFVFHDEIRAWFDAAPIAGLPTDQRAPRNPQRLGALLTKRFGFRD